MAKIMILKFLISTFMLLWFGSPAFAKPWAATSSTPCVTKVLEGVCSESFVDHTKCCDAILNETKADLGCMCQAFDVDESFKYSFVSNCLFIGTIYDKVDTLCRADSTTPGNSTRSTNSTKSADVSPSVRLLYSTSSSNDGKGSLMATLTIITVAIIIIVATFFYVCRALLTVRSYVPEKYPCNNNAFVHVMPKEWAFAESPTPSPSVSINLVPFAPLPMPEPKVSRTSSRRIIDKNDVKTNDSIQFEFGILQAATNNFSDDNKLGEGGFGSVYKGTLSDGCAIAVKRLSHGSKQGEKECKVEIELLTKLQHRNFVRLLGFCLKNGEALLVYELVANKSLDYFLFDNKKREELKWPIRFKIIRGIAQGLLYLHDHSPQRIIHRDLKAANVLLDAKMKPKIGDFGLARICDVEQTHVHTLSVAGTKGYISPEYRDHGKFSTKSDVYAFGALVLEIISGRKIRSQSEDMPENLMATAWRCWTDGKPMELMDPMLKDSCSSDEVLKCIHLGLLCIHDNVDNRPSMSKIVHKLNCNPEVDALAMPQPGFFYNCGSDQSPTSLTAQCVMPSRLAQVMLTQKLRLCSEIAIDSLMMDGM